MQMQATFDSAAIVGPATFGSMVRGKQCLERTSLNKDYLNRFDRTEQKEEVEKRKSTSPSADSPQPAVRRVDTSPSPND